MKSEVLQVLTRERDTAVRERDILFKERDAALVERDVMREERNAAVSERDVMREERDRIFTERATLQQECEALQRERDALRQERDAAVREATILREERDTLRVERDSLSKYIAVPPGHFYSPVVKTEEAEQYLSKFAAADPVDVVPSLEQHLSLWGEFSQLFRTLPCLSGASEHRYRPNNQSFPLSDAIVLQCMVATLRPKAYIEVGSGYSSACLLDVVDDCSIDDLSLTLIEPYPDLLQSLLHPGDEMRLRLVPTGVQDVPLEVFTSLSSGDILFIDSTHVLKTGSDVHFELFEVLPRLPSGVIVHLHDIFWPFEYPREWVLNTKWSWNELYAVRAFLSGNNDFEILFFNHFFNQVAPQQVREHCPPFFRGSPGGLWLRKR